MGINLLELLTKQLGGDSTLGMISGFLGEDSKKTGSALSSMLPSLLGGLMSKASTKGGAGQIFDMISSNGFDGSMLGQLGDVFGGGDVSNGIMNAGGGMLDSIFGNKLGGIVDLISSGSGIGRSSSSSLLKLGLPLIMSFLGKTKKDKGLDAAGLGKLLLGQKDHIAKAAPAGLASALGFANFDEVAKSDYIQETSRKVETNYQKAKETTRETVSTGSRKVKEEEVKGGGMLSKLLPLLLLLVGGFLLWNFFGKGCMNTADNAKAKTENVVNRGANATRNAAGKVVDGAKSAANATGNAVNNAANATRDAAGNVVNGAKSAANATGNAVNNAANATRDAAGNVVNGAKNAANATGNAVKNAANNAGNVVKGAAGAAASSMNGFFSSPQAGKTFTVSGLTFDGKNISASGERELSNIARLMKANPAMKINIEAFADTGKPALDKITGKIRAEKIESKLKSLGIPVNRIRAIGKTGANKVVISQQ